VPKVRRAAAALLLQLGRKTPGLAAEVCSGGCPAALAKFLSLEKDGEACSTGCTLAGAACRRRCCSCYDLPQSSLCSVL
jgi:hypothetical protein